MLSGVCTRLKGLKIRRGYHTSTASQQSSRPKPLLTHAKKASMTPSVEVKFDTHKFHLDAFWLRDNCPSTVHPRTFQRLSPTAMIPLDIQATSVAVEDGKLLVEWPDNHKSVYGSEWLWNHLHRESIDIPPPDSHNTVLWSGKTWSAPEALPVRVDYRNLKSDSPTVAKSTQKSMLRDIYKYGFALVENVPATLEATREVAETIGHLRMTIFGGDSWDYVVESHKEDLLHSDTAYTPMDIKPHTDGTYHHDPAGIQVFHCLDHAGTGGINGLVDGWNILTNIRKTHPDVFNFLTTSPIDFYYADANFSFHTVAPVASLNDHGAITSFKFNNHDRNPPHPLRKDLALYHKSIQVLEQSLENPDNSLDLKLLPGLVLLTYGWRVTHSRTPFTGRRRMAGCYVGRDDFLSKYRVMARSPSSDIQLQ
jgi:trimethyllysine dioxygenase